MEIIYCPYSGDYLVNLTKALFQSLQIRKITTRCKGNVPIICEHKHDTFVILVSQFCVNEKTQTQIYQTILLNVNYDPKGWAGNKNNNKKNNNK